MDKMKRNDLIITCFAVLLLCFGTYAQQVLMDDLSEPEDFSLQWEHWKDTLETHGADFHLTSDEGWANIMDMKLVWLESPHSNFYPPLPINDTTYSESEKAMIRNYVRLGGCLLIGVEGGAYGVGDVPVVNDLLDNPEWEPDIEVLLNHRLGVMYDVVGDIFIYFPPFNDGISEVIFQSPLKLNCGENAYPFAFSGTYDTVVAAISFPFLDECNCSSYIVVVAGNDRWGGDHWPWVEGTDTWAFARNIFLTMAGVPSYEFDPCAFAESTFGFVPCPPEPLDEYSLCSAAPNPFTPNGDGINDEAEFEFPGLGEVPGTIKIFTLGNLRVRTIEVPTGSGAKQAAKWDGRDDSGAPMRQGIYLYTIRAEGRIKCEGTVTLAR